MAMTSTKATEFLTKQLNIQKETVTFRWLSRELSVHVNVAKNELASFYASSQATDEPVHATYLLTGDVSAVKAVGSYHDDDDKMDVEDNALDSIATRKIVLVGEDDLETAKTQFTRTPSIHIYSLSPSVIKDAALLAPMADRVRFDDVSKGKAYNQTIGLVVGSDVKVGYTNKPGSAKMTNAHASASSSKLNPPVVRKKLTEIPKNSDKGKAPETTKPGEKKNGTLDWSKAKTKTEKEAPAAKKAKEATKQESKTNLTEKGGSSKPDVKKEEGTNAKTKDPVESKTNTMKDMVPDRLKRGTKRPSGVMSLSDSEDDNPSPKIKPKTSASPPPSRPASRAKGVKIRKGVLLSDDEESTTDVKPKPRKQKGKGRAIVSDDEDEVDPSLRAMMDLDDSEVTRHNQAFASDHQPDEEDIEMLSDSEPIPVRPKVKRKPKKVIPVGKNGLPKRRVVKSKKSKNAKGYTITEDYSSYESVSESEQVQAPFDTEMKPKKGRKKSVKKEDIASVSASDNSGPSKSKANVNSKDNVSSKAKGGPASGEGKSESKKPGSGSSAGGSKSTSGPKADNGGKKNLMSYFTKK